MNKKEKIIAICFIISFISVIISSIYTINLNKPKNNIYNIEKFMRKL